MSWREWREASCSERSHSPISFGSRWKTSPVRWSSPDDWLNPGPAALLDLGLPNGFLQRAEVRSYGALTVRLASRTDQIAFNLYASVDQGPQSRHFADLGKLGPTPGELLESARWYRTHDPSEAFREMLIQALAGLGVDVDDV